MYKYSDKEIATMREGGKKLSDIMAKLEKCVAAGVSVHDLEMHARDYIAQAGATSGTIGYKPQGAAYAFPSAACISINEEVAHGIAYKNTRVLKQGDLVSIDIIIKYKEMFVDICRTYPVGRVSPEALNLLETARQATKDAVAQAVLGNTVDDIGRAAGEAAKRYGCQTVRELGGHGVGKKIHMHPFVPNFSGSGYQDPIEEGTILAIEPIVSAGDWRIDLGPDQWVFRTRDKALSAQFEETVLITQDGPEVLTAD